MIYYSLISLPLPWTPAQCFYVKMTMCVCSGSPQGVLFVWVNLFSVSTTQKSRITWRTCCQKRQQDPHCLSVRVSDIFLHLTPCQLLVLIPFCCFFINRVTCLQLNWSSPLSCHRLIYTQEECNSVPSVLLFYANFVFVCLFVKHVNMLISLIQCCFLLSSHF